MTGDLVVEHFKPHPLGVLGAIDLRVDNRDGRDLREVLEHREVGWRKRCFAQESVDNERAEARALEDQRRRHRGLRRAKARLAKIAVGFRFGVGDGFLNGFRVGIDRPAPGDKGSSRGSFARLERQLKNAGPETDRIRDNEPAGFRVGQVKSASVGRRYHFNRANEHLTHDLSQIEFGRKHSRHTEQLGEAPNTVVRRTPVWG